MRFRGEGGGGGGVLNKKVSPAIFPSSAIARKKLDTLYGSLEIPSYSFTMRSLWVILRRVLCVDHFLIYRAKKGDAVHPKRLLDSGGGLGEYGRTQSALPSLR